MARPAHSTERQAKKPTARLKTSSPLSASSRYHRRSDRMHLRVDPDMKARISQAAAISGKSASAFMLETVRVAVDRVLRQRPHVEALSEDDWRAFFAALVKPPKPNSALRKGFREYQRRTEAGWRGAAG